LHGIVKPFNNKVDGGVFANNPTLIGIIEAQEAFKEKLSNIRVLSLGTGTQKFSDGEKRNMWGIHYWMLKDKKRRLIDLFMQGQSQMVENTISLMQNGVDKERQDNPSFIYNRITTELNSTLEIEMDETDVDKLRKLAEKAGNMSMWNCELSEYFNVQHLRPSSPNKSLYVPCSLSRSPTLCFRFRCTQITGLLESWQTKSTSSSSFSIIGFIIVPNKKEPCGITSGEYGANIESSAAKHPATAL